MMEGLHAMEDSVAAAMVTFHQPLEQFRNDLTCCEDERKVLVEELVTRSMNVLVEELVTRVDEVKDLKMWVTILKKVVARDDEAQKEHTPKFRVLVP